MAGKGNSGENGGQHGDLIIKLKVKEDSFFKRDGYNIYTEIKLSVVKAVLGTDIQIKTIDGEMKVRVPAGTSHGT